MEKDVTLVEQPLSSHSPQQWHPASLVGPGFFLDSLSCGAAHPRPFKLSSHSQPQSSPQGLTSKAQASATSPNPSGRVSQAGACQSAPIVCACVYLLCPLHTSCCTHLQGSKAPPLSLSVGGLPSVWKPFLFQCSLPAVQNLS